MLVFRSCSGSDSGNGLDGTFFRDHPLVCMHHKLHLHYLYCINKTRIQE